MISWLLHR